MRSTKLIIKKTDFDFRISQKLGLTYCLYSKKDSDALVLLESLQSEHDYSLEWDSQTKKYSLIIYINIIGQKFSESTIREVIVKAFTELYLSGDKK
jgi:hypothetical protein